MCVFQNVIRFSKLDTIWVKGLLPREMSLLTSLTFFLENTEVTTTFCIRFTVKMDFSYICHTPGEILSTNLPHLVSILLESFIMKGTQR